VDGLAQTAASLDLEKLESEDAVGVLGWAFENFHPSMAISIAGGSEGLAVLDMAFRLEPSVRLFTLDTGRLHRETHELFEQVERRYGIRIERHHPDPGQLKRMEDAFGADLMYDGVNFRALCCQIRKIQPMKRALSGLNAYVTGIRRSQTATRADIHKAEIDAEQGGIVKINPLADWTGEQVKDYVREHDLPVHPLFSKGYASVGCEPCTRPIGEGEDERAGRWWWETDAPKECGLHSRPTGALDFELQEIVGEESG
jgi:thioredoxin-dependent adenylylsulfate APS reductase